MLSKSSTTSASSAKQQFDKLCNNKPENILYSFGSGDEDNVDSKAAALNPTSGVPMLPALADLHASHSVMDDETHAERKDLREAMKTGKGTEIAYPRHIKNYVNFMTADQAARQTENPEWRIVPPFPITARNVAAFLKFETTRPKNNSDGEPILGTRLGYETIKQCISALENWRHTHEHEFKDDNEALRPLREDARIRTYEANARTSESERNADAQLWKAKGTTADTYTREEITRASMWCLQFEGTNSQVHIGIRDRAMLLLSTAIAFRGDNTRSLLLSDLYLQDVRLIELGLDVTATALVCFSDQGKTNTSGRIDEQAAFRHRLPELCPIGGLGFYFFSQFHIITRERPYFVPDFSKGEDIGYRSWYKIFLFPGLGGDDTAMTYENHRKRVILMYTRNGINIRKVTHAGRPFAATSAREHGATVEGTKALGNWSQGTLRNCYDRMLPIDAMLAAASFNGKRQDSYFLARDALDPPMALASTIFPWIEEEKAAYQQQCQEHGNRATDVALSRFLSLLEHLRTVILQDAAVLYPQYPHCSIFRFPPFNSLEFAAFSAHAAILIQQAEIEAQQRLKDLPETMVASLRGILTTSNLHQEHARNESRREHAHVNAQLQVLDALIRAQFQSKSKRRKITLSLLDGTTVSSKSQILQPSELALPNLSCSQPVPSPRPSSLLSPTLPVTVTSTQTVSSSGNVYPFTTFPLLSDTFVRVKQLTCITKLEAIYPAERLAKHQFEWTQSITESQDDEWLPIYTYWRPRDRNSSPSITDIWNEWSHGIDGCLSVSQLTETWGARWRRNNSAAKTEASRRKKVVTLVEALSSRLHWNAEHALQYLTLTYPIPTPSVPHLKNTRAFIDCLQKRSGEFFEEIIKGADRFIS